MANLPPHQGVYLELAKLGDERTIGTFRICLQLGWARTSVCTRTRGFRATDAQSELLLLAALVMPATTRSATGMNLQTGAQNVVSALPFSHSWSPSVFPLHTPSTTLARADSSITPCTSSVFSQPGSSAHSAFSRPGSSVAASPARATPATLFCSRPPVVSCPLLHVLRLPPAEQLALVPSLVLELNM